MWPFRVETEVESSMKKVRESLSRSRKTMVAVSMLLLVLVRSGNDEKGGCRPSLKAAP